MKKLLTFKKIGYIIVNELWLRNFFKLAQTKKPLPKKDSGHTCKQRKEQVLFIFF